MFERYTESARRVLFFARYEVSELGATLIEPEHVLLGLTRQSDGPVPRVMELSGVSLDSLRGEVESVCVFREKIPTSVEIPFSASTQHLLRYAAEEADRLKHNYVGPEHLLIGLLREGQSVAATILMRHGLHPDGVRSAIVKLPADHAASSTLRSRSEASEQIDEIKQLVEQLQRTRPDTGEANALAEHIRERLEALKRHFDA